MAENANRNKLKWHTSAKSPKVLFDANSHFHRDPCSIPWEITYNEDKASYLTVLKNEWIRPSIQIHKPKVNRVYSGPGLILQSSLEGILSEVFVLFCWQTNQQMLMSTLQFHWLLSTQQLLLLLAQFCTELFSHNRTKCSTVCHPSLATGSETWILSTS